MRKLLEDALAIPEVHYQLVELDAVDDKKDVSEYDDAFIISEVRFCLEKYQAGSGFFHAEELAGERGKEAQVAAKAEVKAMEAFLKKYAPKEVK